MADPQQELRDVVTAFYGGGKHTFTISVNIKGGSANWSTDLVPQEVTAYSLFEALQIATATPLEEWFPGETTDDAGERAR